MRKLLVALFLYAFSSIALNAQAFIPIKANEAFATALTYAQNNGMQAPKLVFYGMMKQTITVPIVGEVQINFNISSGKSESWVFLFRENSDTTQKAAYAVYQTTLLGFGTTSVPINQITGVSKIDMSKVIEDPQIIDSDIFAETLRGSADFMDFYNAHPNPTFFAISMTINSYNPNLTMGAPYWEVLDNDGSAGKACAVHGLTKAMTCSYSSVAGESASQPEIYPNPASDKLAIANNSLSTLTICDALGRILINKFIQTDFETIELGNLPDGVYFAKFGRAGAEKVVPVMIIK